MWIDKRQIPFQLYPVELFPSAQPIRFLTTLYTAD